MKYEQTNEEYPASSDENSRFYSSIRANAKHQFLNRAGNGSLMRLCPVPFFYVKNPSLAIEKSAGTLFITLIVVFNSIHCSFMNNICIVFNSTHCSV
jgi:ADP-ribosylglycohydrolase